MRRKIEYDEAEFRRLWNQGARAADIAEHFGASVASWTFKTANNLDLPKRNGAPLKDADVRRLWREKMSIAEIADELGAPSAAIMLRAKALELPARRGRSYDYAKPERDEKPKPIGKGPRKLPPHPRWPATLDLRVYQTGGRYAAIAALSEDIRRPIAAIQARWHLIGGRA